MNGMNSTLHVIVLPGGLALAESAVVVAAFIG